MLAPSGECLPCREAVPLHCESQTPITLWVDNPKTKNTMSFTRYERYKAAKTFQEMLELGARKDDLYHDYAKGLSSSHLSS
jgi:hypothetical protein